MKNPDTSKTAALRKRLETLDPEQRRRLLQKLRSGSSKSLSADAPSVIPKAKSLRSEVEAANSGDELRVEVYPASHTQERMWFLHEYERQSPVYSSPMAFQIPASIDAGILERAFEVVIQRHDSLRTTFLVQEAQLYQRVSSNTSFVLDRVLLADDLEESGSLLTSKLTELACHPFNLTKGPLLRAHLLESDSETRVLLIILHHIISDGWSRANLCQQLATAYEELSKDKVYRPPDLPIQFADYSTWQDESFKQDSFQEHLSYWKNRFSDDPPPLELPLDSSRPTYLTSVGEKCIWELDSSLIDNLKKIAQQEGCTLFMILIAAYKALLSRYSGQEDLVVGVPIANRHRKDIEGLIGCFINSLAMRTDLSGNPSLREFLGRVKQTALEAYRHQVVPYERLLGELKLKRKTSRSPIFQTTFALQDFQEVQLDLDGCSCESVAVHTKTCKVEIAMAVFRSKGSWYCEIEYSTDLFSKDRIERMGEHWKVLLEGIVNNPDARISELPLLAGAEMDQMKAQWESARRSYPLEGGVHQLFEEQVLKTPEATAIVFEGQRISYRELNSRANRLARYLRELGVEPDHCVGLLMERTSEMLVGILGILKAGGAYVPLDTAAPEKRLSELAKDAGIRVLVTIEKHADAITIDGLVPVLLDRPEAWTKFPDSNLESLTQGNHLAYVIYTSGSTGHPKGVLVEHRQLRNYVFGVLERFDLQAGNYAMLQPITVDSTQTMLFPAWACGGTIHLISWIDSLNPKSIKKYFEEQAIDYLKIAPAHLTAILDGAYHGNVLPGRGLIMGGEALSWSLVRNIAALKPSCRVWNHYGPTETTVGVITQEIDLGDEGIHGYSGTVPLGYPLPNTRVHVLDTHGQKLPVGIRGELYISGEPVTRGYLKRKEQTKSVFLPDPFSDAKDTRMYRTGDFVRCLPDGRIEFLGRADGQVKIRGFRVELGEIEAVFAEHPDVSEQAVLLQTDPKGRPVLMAYVVLKHGADLSSTVLRQFLSTRLPSHMVPGSIQLLDAMPRTKQGKLFRRGLPDVSAGVEKTSVADKPSEPLPEPDYLDSIREIWKDILHVEHIGHDDDFFLMGGHSLTATLILMRIHKELKVEISMRKFFQNPTLDGLMAFITEEKGRKSSSLAPMDSKVGDSTRDFNAAASCFLIGDGRMPIEVVKVLQLHGIRICGVSTSDEAILNWTREHGIPSVGPEVDIQSFLETEPFDYLFSVVNSRILSAEVLRLPRKMAINFHDAPLPRFAGVNAPAWGIIKQASEYGVTWHAMVPEIDAGAILKQVPVHISKEDTFLSIGLKCVEAGVEALGELLEELKSKTFTLSEQDSSKRTYFNRFERPAPACVLQWDKTAEELDAMHRGLDFGPLFNPIGSVKLFLDNTCAIVGELKVVNESCSEYPGTVLSIDGEGLKVATATKPVLLNKFYTTDAASIKMEVWVETAEIQEGDRLPLPDADQCSRLTKLSNAIIRHDPYWRRRLNSLNPVSLLRGERTSGVVNQVSSSKRIFKVPVSWGSEYSEDPERRRCYLVAAWAAFIARISGEDCFDIEVLLGENSRRLEIGMGLISPFLPLRMDGDLGRPLVTLVDTVAEKIGELLKHPLFGRDLVYRDPVLFGQAAFQQLHKVPLGLWQVSSLDEQIELQGYDCLLLVPEEGDVCGIACSPDVLDQTAAENLAGSFANFLQNLSQRPDQMLSGIRMLSTDEEKVMISRGHGPKGSYALDLPVHRIFEAKVASQPDSIAVVMEEQSLTYGQLNSYANQLANRLLDSGLKPDDLVGLCLDRSLEMVIGILGIQKAGGAYLPLDPSYPSNRINYIVEDARTVLIVTNQKLSGILPMTAGKLLLVDISDFDQTKSYSENPQTAAGVQNLAYTIYTSGSTGAPKGVQVEHRSLVNYILAANEYYGVTPKDRILQLASLNFDSSVEEIYCALTSGATLVLRTEEMLSSQAHFVNCCQEWKITVLPLPTAFWHSWVMAMEREDLPIPDSLRIVIIGGEQAAYESLLQWQNRVGTHVRLINSYGPTETTVCATWCDLTALDLSGKQLPYVPIGKPVSNLQAYVLDSHRNLLPQGVPGELFIGGAGLARGYFNNPELTVETFVADPFSESPDARLYRSGDKVMMNQDGNLIFLGRIDRQVKIRGFRIELGEIEACMSHFPGIVEAFVTAVESETGDLQLAAYLVEAAAKVDIGQLKNHLKQQLPGYMVPFSFTLLENVPLTPNGKVDYKALPEPVIDRSHLEQPMQAPRTALEASLVKIWSEVIDADEIGVNDNFFELGGHSLVASQVISRIREEFQVEVSLRSFFDAPTVAKLSTEIQGSEKEGLRDSIKSNNLSDKDRLPLSFAQHRLWFLDRFKGSSAEYNIPRAMRLKGRLDRVALEKAINVIVDRHDSLRTYFGELKGEAYQVVVPSLHIDLPFIDLRNLPVSSRDKVLIEAGGEGFDLCHPPLIRVAVYQVDIEEYILLITLHHIVSDGWSMGVLRQELSHCYNAFVADEQPSLKPLVLQYPAYALRQREQLQGDRLEKLIGYWRNYLKDAPTLELPTDHPRPVRLTYNGSWQTFKLQSPLVDQLNEFNRSESLTPYMSLQAAFLVLLARFSGQQDLLIGTPYGNRQDHGEESLIGFFVNTLVIRGDVSGDVTFRELVKRVRDASLDAHDYHELPFEKLVEEINPKRDPSRHPLFQVVFSLLNVPEKHPVFTGMDLSDYPLQSETTHFDLSLTLQEEDDSWVGHFTYNTDLFDSDTINQLCNQFPSILKDVLTSPDIPVVKVAGPGPDVKSDEAIVQEIWKEVLMLEEVDWEDDFFLLGGQSTAAMLLLIRIRDRLDVDIPMRNFFTDPTLVSLMKAIREEKASQGIPERTNRPSKTEFFESTHCLQELFEEHAAQQPDAPALSFEGKELTYGELNSRANQLAHFLRIKGVQPDTLVAVCMDRSLDLIVSILGILKSGAAYLPIDLVYPSVRTAFMLNDAEAKLLLTQSDLLESLPETQAEMIAVDDPALPLRSASSENPDRVHSADHLAYVIYTSGSTGQPKGVEVTHRNVVRLFRATEDWYDFNSGDVWCMFHSHAFDFSVWEIWGALLYGGRLVVVPFDTSRSPHLFYDLLVREKITVLNQTPSAFGQLSRFEDSSKDLPPLALRWIIFGGEALEMKSLQSWFERHGDQRPCLVNMYGITETTVHVTYRPLTKDDLAAGSVIGEPIPDLQLYLLDTDMNPVPTNVSGEIYVGGAGLARGYLNRPDLTAERFVDDPFSSVPGARLYRTGDLARRQTNGEIEYLGRIDHQVQLRGFRIELGEIEAVLNSMSEVREARVMLREDQPGDKRLAAYLLAEGDVHPSVQYLRQSLASKLPDYMVPGAYVLLESYPLTPNGKLDFKALPVPQIEREHLNEPLVQPQSPIEKILANIWSEILEVNEVGGHDNFFELGGHSLLATQVVARIRQELEVEIPLRIFFDAPTVVELAKEILGLNENLTIPEIDEEPEELRLPLSFAQQRLWFLDRLKGSSAEYNMPRTVLLKGDLNLEALEKSLNFIVQRHDSLRTYFGEIGGKSYQVVVPDLRIEVPCIDLRGLPAIEREKTFIEMGSKAFDLQQLPLLRAVVYQVDESEYAFHFNMHHIISDGWSMGLINRELSICYNAFVAGEEPSLGPLELQYPEYASQQLDRLQDQRLEEQVTYWRDYLKDPPTLELPTDRPRPSRQTFNGSRHLFTLGPALSARLKTFNHSEMVTPFMSLQAALLTLLSRYSGQEDILIGTPFANRQQVEEETMIGFFINTLVIRGDLSGNVTFRQLIKRVRNDALDAFQYNELPFEKLVEELNPKRDPSRHPLFQVMFALQNAPMAKPELAGLELSDLLLKGVSTHFDLTVSLREEDGDWQGVISYNTDLFDADTINRFCDHYKSILEGVLDFPDRPVSQVPMLTQEEEKQLFHEWSQCVEECPEDQTIHGMIEAQVEKTPDSVAVVFEDRSLTYRELDLKANQLAHYLKTKGVGPEVLVGVCVERSIEMLAGLLAILKAGGAYVPLDPHFPPNRLAVIMEDADISLLITQRSFLDLCSGFSGERLFLDEWKSDSLDVDSCPSVTPHTSAYVIYTSGSTGRPKGTVIEHCSAVNMLNTLRYRPGMTSKDVFLAVATISFDISVFELFGPLTVGARLVIMPDSMRADGRKIKELFESSQSTVMHGTPSMWRLLMFAGWKGGPGVKALAGGEELTSDLAEKILPNCRELWNLYGPTETTVWSLIDRIYSPDTISIGKPVGNTQVYIVDDQNQMVPVGIPGELLIGGRGLAREYLKRPDLTTERFIPHLFSDRAGERLYRTGDLCRWRSDGTIDYLGRIDNQVKIRGYRIELGEIEACLMQHPAVRVCATRVWDDSHGGKRIVAYAVPESGDHTPDNQELVEFVRDQLPDYMVPSSIQILDQLPQTPNAKLDRNALPEPQQGKTEKSVSPKLPATQIEKILAGIWSELLGVVDPGLEDSFFDLGGHSLLAFQVVTRIQDLTKVDIDLRQFFESPTIGKLSKLVEESGTAVLEESNTPETPSKEAEDVPAQDTSPFDEPRVCPISFAQYRLWFLEKLEGNLVAYNMPLARRIRGKLDVEVFRQTLETIVARHETYRTVFIAQDGEPMQLINPPAPFDLPVIDLSHLETEVQESEVLRHVQVEAAKPFDLERDLMIRASILYLNDEHHVLMLTEHHIASDGWSHRVLWREIKAIYEAYHSGQDSPLAPLALQYATFAQQQKERLQGAYWNKLLSFWKSELDGVTPLELPTDRPRPAKLSNRGKSESIHLEQGLVKRLRGLAKSMDMTLLMTFMATFQVLLSRLSGQKDIVVGMPTASRRTTDEENIIGLFVNTILLRGDLSDDPTFAEFLKRIKIKSLAALDHQEMPFEMLVEELQPERDLSRNPLFQVLVNMQENLSGRGLEISGLTMSGVARNRVQTKFDLTLYISVNENSASLSIVYSTDLFDPQRIEIVMAQFARLLEQATEAPDKPVSTFSLVTENQAQRIPDLNEPMKAPAQVSVLRQLLDQATSRPAHPAVSQGESSWSYEALSSRLLELASFLRDAGLKPNDRVMIDGDKTFGCIVSLLGTLAAGGVIVPVDAELPAERKRQMTSQAGARWLLRGTKHGNSGEWFEETASLHVLQVDSRTGQLDESTGQKLSLDEVFQPDADSPAYVFFTSGTTGRPKGILGRYEGLNHFINWQKEHFAIKPEDRVSQLTSLSFDVSLRDIFLPLASGATLCLPPSRLLPISTQACDWLRQERISVLHTVPSIMEAWLQTIEKEEFLVELRWTFSAGEPLQSDLVAAWRKCASNTSIINLYGPTETTLAKCWYRVPEKPVEGIQAIGAPIPGAAAMIMNSELRPAGIGEQGEIVIRTPFTSLGYLDSGNENPSAFVANPYREDPRDLFYRSGDLGRVRPDGVIEILGRLDDQIKIRGVRIEPSAVERVLETHPSVKTCRVIGSKDSSGENCLVAYLVAFSPPTQEELYSHLAVTLPPSMIPSSFVVLEELPLTLNGKLDRKALPAPEFYRANLEVKYVAPRTETERKLAAIVSDLLGIEEVGIRDNFFHLGGNSLQAVRLCYQVEKQLGNALRVASIFEAPTIEVLAKIVSEEQENAGFADLWKEGEGTPVFFLPGITRNALVFRELVNRLEMDAPVYGLELPSPKQTGKPENDLTVLAAYCADEIRKIQPEGPYRLVGYSFGGMLSYETARQLQENSSSRSSAIFFDAFVRKPQSFSVFDRLVWFGKMLMHGHVHYLHFLLREIYFWCFQKLGRDLRVLDAGVNEILTEDIGSIRTAPIHRSYEPKPFPLRLLMFNTRVTEFSITQGHLLRKWNDYCMGKVDFCRLNVDYHPQILVDKRLDEILPHMQEFLAEDVSEEPPKE